MNLFAKDSMTSLLTTADFHDAQLTVFGTHEEPWFVAKEVGDILGIKNYRNFVSKLPPHRKGVEDGVCLVHGVGFPALTRTARKHADKACLLRHHRDRVVRS